jgi:hypothetical protein
MSQKSELGCKIRCCACNEFATRHSSVTPACRGISGVTWAQRNHHAASECPRTSPYEFHATFRDREREKIPTAVWKISGDHLSFRKTRCYHPAQPHASFAPPLIPRIDVASHEIGGLLERVDLLDPTGAERTHVKGGTGICHGRSGQSNGVAARPLPPRAKDSTTSVLLRGASVAQCAAVPSVCARRSRRSHAWSFPSAPDPRRRRRGRDRRAHSLPADAAGAVEPTVAQAERFFELNDTDGDLGIHAAIDGGVWTSLSVEGPDDRQLLGIVSQGRLRGQGLPARLRKRRTLLRRTLAEAVLQSFPGR